MSETDEARWAQLAEAATPGPWEMFRYRTGGGRIHISGDDGRKRSLIADMDGEPDAVATVYNEADREFLFAARDAVPALLAEVSRLRAENERLTRARQSIRQIAVDRGQIMWAAEESLAAARVEVSQLRAKIERVEALRMRPVLRSYYGDTSAEEGFRITMKAVRAALAAPANPDPVRNGDLFGELRAALTDPSEPAS